MLRVLPVENHLGEDSMSMRIWIASLALLLSVC